MSDKEKVLKILNNNNGILKTEELYDKNINTEILTRLVRANKLERVTRGLYMNPDKFEDEYYIFQYKCPKAIFSHETALYFHDLTDRTPNALMVTVPSGYNSRLLKDKNYTFSYLKEDLYKLGNVKVKTPFGNEVNCYDIERTIIDIIRDRDKIEKYQFNDALKRYSNLKVKDIPKLYKYAEKFNLKDEVKKYIEILS